MYGRDDSKYWFFRYASGIEVKPDSDGEERVMSVDTVLELDMKLYREEEHDRFWMCTHL